MHAAPNPLAKRKKKRPTKGITKGVFGKSRNTYEQQKLRQWNSRMKRMKGIEEKLKENKELLKRLRRKLGQREV